MPANRHGTARLAAWVGSLVLALAFLTPQTVSAQTAPIVLGQSTVSLYGPWRFHTGDDGRWKDPAFDDAAWETVDLAPKPGAHDPDVGIRGYVPGWSARGHKGYAGYAWYRLRIAVQADGKGPLAIEGPPYVDGAYQLYLNGRLLGGDGTFGAGTPTIYSRQPRKFVLPADVFEHGPVEVAIRVYEPIAFIRGDPQAGGVQAAPSIGEADAIGAEHDVRWMEVFWGYLVDGVEGLIFFGLAAFASMVMAFDRARAPAYRWMILGLIVMGLTRGNQSFFAWLQVEDITFFDMFRNVVLIALAPLAWTMTWRDWFGPKWPTWGPKAIIGLSVVYGVLALLTRSEVTLLPAAAMPLIHLLAQIIRLVFLTWWLVSAGVGLVQQRANAILPVLTLVAMGVCVFVQELQAIHVPGIWFPFGVGVSRTEYACAVFDVLLAALLTVELLKRAPGPATRAASA